MLKLSAYKFFIRLIAGLVAGVFTFTTLVWAAPLSLHNVLAPVRPAESDNRHSEGFPDAAKPAGTLVGRVPSVAKGSAPANAVAKNENVPISAKGVVRIKAEWWNVVISIKTIREVLKRVVLDNKMSEDFDNFADVSDKGALENAINNNIGLEPEISRGEFLMAAAAIVLLFLTILFQVVPPIRKGMAFLFKDRRPLGPTEKAKVSEIIDAYNTAYGLNINEKKKKEIINKQIVYRLRKYFVSNKIIPASLLFAFSIITKNAVKRYSLRQIDRRTFIITIVLGIIACVVNFAIIILIFIEEMQAKIFGGRVSGDIIELNEHLIKGRLTLVLAHEMAHLLKLPHHLLLAEAYAFLVGYKVDNIFLTILSSKYALAEQALEVILDDSVREATIRKILSQQDLRRAYLRCFSNKQQLNNLLREVSHSLSDKDYKLPHCTRGFEDSNLWAYEYGRIMGYIALVKCRYHSDGALRYIYRLGQVSDSRKWKVPQLMSSRIGNTVQGTTSNPPNLTRLGSPDYKASAVSAASSAALAGAASAGEAGNVVAQANAASDGRQAEEVQVAWPRQGGVAEASP